MNDLEYYLLKVPIKWNDLYQKLLELMVNFGIDIIKDCNASCSNNGKKLINCWMTFNVACTAFELENYKESNILITIVVDCLNRNYNTDFNIKDYIINISDDYEFNDETFNVVDDGVTDFEYNFDNNVFKTEVIEDGTNNLEFDNNVFNTEEV